MGVPITREKNILLTKKELLLVVHGDNGKVGEQGNPVWTSKGGDGMPLRKMIDSGTRLIAIQRTWKRTFNRLVCRAG